MIPTQQRFQTVKGNNVRMAYSPSLYGVYPLVRTGLSLEQSHGLKPAGKKRIVDRNSGPRVDFTSEASSKGVSEAATAPIPIPVCDRADHGRHSPDISSESSCRSWTSIGVDCKKVFSRKRSANEMYELEWEAQVLDGDLGEFAFRLEEELIENTLRETWESPDLGSSHVPTIWSLAEVFDSTYNALLGDQPRPGAIGFAPLGHLE